MFELKRLRNVCTECLYVHIVSQLLPNTENNKLSWSFIQTVVNRLCILINFPTKILSHYVENSLHLVQSIINPQCVFDRVHVLRCCFDVCFRTNLLLHLLLFFWLAKVHSWYFDEPNIHTSWLAPHRHSVCSVPSFSYLTTSSVVNIDNCATYFAYLHGISFVENEWSGRSFWIFSMIFLLSTPLSLVPIILTL